MEGDELIAKLAQATGLPQPWVESELRQLAEKRGLNPQSLTLEQFRELMAEFLQDILLEAKQELNSET